MIVVSEKMLLLIIIPLSLHIQNMPIPMINALKKHTEMGKNNLQEKDVSWKKTNNCKNIIDKYFYITVALAVRGELSSVFGNDLLKTDIY